MCEGKKEKNGNPSHLWHFKKCLVKKNMKKSYHFISFKSVLQEITVFTGNLHSREKNGVNNNIFQLLILQNEPFF